MAQCRTPALPQLTPKVLGRLDFTITPIPSAPLLVGALQDWHLLQAGLLLLLDDAALAQGRVEHRLAEVQPAQYLYLLTVPE